MKRFVYLILFFGICAAITLTHWLPENLGIVLSASIISILYLALFRENFLNFVVILLFALTPYYLLIPLAMQLLSLVMPSYITVSLLAHIGILAVYLLVKIIIFFENPKKQISPMINISALIFVNILIYATWYSALEKSFVSGEPITMFTHVVAVAGSILLNGLIILNFIKTESKLESLKDYDEIKMTVSPLIENNIGIQEGFAKHLKSLKCHIDGTDKQANAYIDEIILNIEEENELSRWQKPVIGALMIRKKQEAAEKGIRLETVTDGQEMRLPVPDYLLISILAHMIDYAVEWTDSMDTENRVLDLYIGGEELMISISGGKAAKKIPGHKNRIPNRCKSRYIELKRLVKETKGRIRAAAVLDECEISVYYQNAAEAEG